MHKVHPSPLKTETISLQHSLPSLPFSLLSPFLSLFIENLLHKTFFSLFLLPCYLNPLPFLTSTLFPITPLIPSSFPLS